MISPRPFLLIAMLSLLTGMTAGLVRIGWPIPLPDPRWALLHGPFMVSAFLGILISLERVVALQKNWMWGAPLFCSLGALSISLHPNPILAACFFSIGGIFLVSIFIWICIKYPNLFHGMMLGGAFCFGIGNLLWFLGKPFPQIIFWWMAFLLLTIAGERLELSRFRNPSKQSKFIFVAFNVLFVLGIIFQYFQIPLFQYLLGGSLLGISIWLLTQDIALQSLKARGLTRYIAWSLMLGYGWLIACGVLLLFFGQEQAGWNYDAFLHSFFLGFVFSMIFGHAPLILPSMLKVEIKYSSFFYIPLFLLHSTVLGRLLGDLSHSFALRKWMGALNAFVIVIFFVNILISVRRKR